MSEPFSIQAIRRRYREAEIPESIVRIAMQNPAVQQCVIAFIQGDILTIQECLCRCIEALDKANRSIIERTSCRFLGGPPYL